MRNVLEEFGSENYGKSKPTILGLREHIFTGRYVHLSSSVQFYLVRDIYANFTFLFSIIVDRKSTRLNSSHPV